MSLPLLLLVDDSEAVLAFETAALGQHFKVSTAHDGIEALEQLTSEVPALMVLDLSMPQLDGEGVLQAVRADPRLAALPIIVVSSEIERGRSCLTRGAEAFLPKPIRADELLAAATRVLEARRDARRRQSLACLPVRVGGVELALSLEAVDCVVPQIATLRLVDAPPHLCEVFELHGELVLMLDLATRLGLSHVAELLERKVVVLRGSGQRLSLCVDDAHDPEEVPPEQVTRSASEGGTLDSALGVTTLARVHSSRGELPVIASAALFDPAELSHASAQIRAQLKNSGPRARSVGAAV